ncbi:hypothetical protein D3C77_447470 [compost metagenome]
MDARKKDELRREMNLLEADGKTFKYRNNKQESPYSGKFTGTLTGTDLGSRFFEATSVSISDGEYYQVVGDYRIPESGIYEWIVINVHTTQTGPVKIITFDEWLDGKEGVVMGGLVGNFPFSYSRGVITIDSKSSDGFEVSDLKFTYSSGEKEYSFSDGHVSIEKN